MLAEIVGMQMKEVRDRANLSQEAAGALVGVSLSVYRKWEIATSSPSVAHVEKFAEVFDVPLPWLLGLGEPATATGPAMEIVFAPRDLVTLFAATARVVGRADEIQLLRVVPGNRHD